MYCYQKFCLALPRTGLATWQSKWYNTRVSTTVRLLDELKELKELLSGAAQRSGKSPGQLMRETMTLQWKGYDPGFSGILI